MYIIFDGKCQYTHKRLLANLGRAGLVATLTRLIE